jgi:acyl-CoA synthetase (AMP-forming)/AMP-acid ligase II
MRVIDYFDKGAEIDPGRAAIIFGDLIYTYREAQALTHRIAAGMFTSGFEIGHKVAVYSNNDPLALLCMLGLWRAGGIWVPANVRNSLENNIEYLDFVGVQWLFYHSEFVDNVIKMQSAVPTLQHLVCIDRDMPEHVSLGKLIEQGENKTVPDWSDPFGNPDQIMALWPTGGTTGRSKAVMMNNLSWGVTTEITTRYWYCADPPPVCLMVAPITHAAGGIAVMMTNLGATNVIMRGFDPLGVMQHIEQYQVTHLFLPPTAYYALLAHPRVREFDYASLRYFMVSSAPVAADKLKEGVGIFGPCLCQSFGQAESPVILTWQDPATIAAAARGDHPERLHSCGRETYPVRVAIMDDEGRLLPPGERGEIVARGTLVTPGYYNNPEATQEIRTHGWHHTGDIGYRDAAGYFYIVDRKKDMIITGGFNVYSVEVEAAVLSLPAVKECAVIGVPDDKWGEAIKVVVVLKAGESIDAAGIIAHCKDRLGGVKAPKSVEFRGEIPKTPTGKTDKKAIRAPYWAGQERAVH